MDIQQIQMQYLPEEDRLLLRMNTAEQSQLSFLLTRR